ncbi:MAG: tyrosine-protein phosphatase [Kiritimatiellae bacterium]|nr:tyrosine-protein phosphatase [Kiritimatiellia bacterium]
MLGAALLHSSADAGTLSIVSPEEGQAVSALTDVQREFLAMPRAERAKWMIDPGRRKELRGPRKGRPLPTTLRWKDDMPAGSPRRSYVVEVCRAMDGLPVFLGTTSGYSIDVPNLEIARTWNWTVRALEGDRVLDEASGTFRTEDLAPRLIDAGDVPNARDIGGRRGLDGRMIRQGLVFRTAGLNDNARKIYYTFEELLAIDKTGEIKARSEEILSYEAKLKALRDSTNTVKQLDFPLSGEWTVFYPTPEVFKEKGDAAMEDLGDEIPADFLGAAPKCISADFGNKVVLGEPKDRRGPAVLMQCVESDADGWATISCGADWYWSLRVGGQMVVDNTLVGNVVPIAIDNYTLLIPVRKGRNLVVATVASGSGGWSWLCRSAPPEPLSNVIAGALKAVETSKENLFKVEKCTEKGKTRINDGNCHLLLDTFALKTDIDLRSKRECWGMEGSPLGSTVEWVHVSSGAYGGMQNNWERDQFTKVFRVFLDKAKYPIVFHCIGGRDRTGAVAFILESLLGVDEDEMRKDWEVTVFQDGDMSFRTDRLFDNMVLGFDKWPGETLCERVEAYVISLGFTKEDVAFLRDWLLEP